MPQCHPPHACRWLKSLRRSTTSLWLWGERGWQGAADALQALQEHQQCHAVHSRCLPNLRLHYCSATAGWWPLSRRSSSQVGLGAPMRHSSVPAVPKRQACMGGMAHVQGRVTPQVPAPAPTCTPF